MTWYHCIKTFHLFFVVAWLAAVLCLPRLLKAVEAAAGSSENKLLLVGLGLGLYRLGHHLFGIAAVLGLLLWLSFGVGGSWLHVKLVLVTLLLTHYTVGGRWLKGVSGGLPFRRLPRWWQWAPPVILMGILWLALAKPPL